MRIDDLIIAYDILICIFLTLYSRKIVHRVYMRYISPYIHFSISKIQKYKLIYKNAKVTSFSSLISKEWKALPEDDKNKWRMFAEKDKKRYDDEKSLYKGPWQVPSDRPRKVSSRYIVDFAHSSQGNAFSVRRTCRNTDVAFSSLHG